MTLTVYIDWETRSEIDIKKCGAHNYAIHPSTEIMCLGWAVEQSPVKITPFVSPRGMLLFESATTKTTTTSDIEPLFEAVRNGALVVAHNVGFDRSIWDKIAVKKFGFPEVPEDNWRCSAAAAAHYGASNSLEDACKILNLPEGKLESKAMKALSQPLPAWKRTGRGEKWNEDPDKFNKLYRYCRRDVQKCRELWKICPPLSPLEFDVWKVDQKINSRGAPVDVSLAKKCAKMHDEITSRADTEIHQITKGAVKTARARSMLTWLRHKGVTIPNLQAETIRDLLKKEHLPGDVVKVLRLREQGSGAASAKYQAIIDAVSPDGRVRGLYIYYGGRLGRWSGKRVQPQNLIRPPKQFSGRYGGELIRRIADEFSPDTLNFARAFGTDREILAGLLRATFCAPAGKVFMSLDFAQIEARVLAWIAGEKQLLEDFARGVDLYVEMAKRIDPANPSRPLGKEAILGLGYGMWQNTFADRCASRGLTVSRHVTDTAVVVYRRTFTRIVQLWEDVKNAAQDAILHPGETCGLRWTLCRPRRDRVSCIAFLYDREQQVLAVKLPSGRCIYYHRAALNEDGISYYARTGDEETGKVDKIRSWGSKLVENITQGIAACILREALVRLDREMPESPVVLHTHDDIMIESDDSNVERKMKKFHRIITTLPPWARGLPLAADGWSGKRNRKER